MNKQPLPSKLNCVLDFFIPIACAILICLVVLLISLIVSGCSTPHAVIVTQSPSIMPPVPISNQEISSFASDEVDTNAVAPSPTNVTISCSAAPWTLQATSGMALPFTTITNVNGNFVTVPIDADDRQFRAAVFASSHLSWNAVTDTNVAGVNIYFGTDTDDFDSQWSVAGGSATNTEVLGLQWSTTYYFTAVSYDAEGNESPESNIATYTTPAAPPQPTVNITSQ